ncbi:MAG: hypothetical protein AAGC88_04795 [Bacteroidota bacterium]
MSKLKLIVVLTLFGSLLPVLTSKAQRFKEGYYYTNEGEKVVGQVRHVFSAKFGNMGDNTIVFRERKGAKKLKLDSYEIKSFVIEKDSFIVVKNFKINAFANYSRDFAKVLISGKLTLLLHHTTATNGSGAVMMTTPVTTYLINGQGKTRRMSTNKDFRQVLPTFLVGAPEIIEKIESKDYSKPHLRQIIREYNEKFESKKT